MSAERPAEYGVSLVRELCALPSETEWVEFKVNEAEPENIGENISALAHSAATTPWAAGGCFMASRLTAEIPERARSQGVYLQTLPSVAVVCSLFDGSGR